MKLENRKEDILEFVVRDYIKTAQPVSSGRISQKRSSFGSPATVRNIMLELDDEGFLFQPHTSAGRAPTDKGYRYFVNGLSHKKSDNFQPYDTFSFFESFFVEMANELEIFVGIVSESESKAQKLVGLKNLLSRPEFLEESMFEDFGDIMDDFEDVVDEYRNALLEQDEMFNIWIGKENIYPKAKCGSTIVARFLLPDEEKVTLFTFGPKRMDYETAINKINSLINKNGKSKR
ncbi:hypothetical protein HYS99_01235 [Candidatus Giovannonibacteria bacterium]|nr:hypothetical protein [Candidatus Giovannonibacteria bacterium]